jgi:flagellin
MRELAVQSANGSQSGADRSYLNTEFTQLTSEITRIQSNTAYDGTTLIGSATGSTVSFQVGIGTSSDNQIGVSFGGVNLATVIADVVSGTNSASALTAISDIDAAMTTVSTSRATYGAAMNRFDVTISNIQTARTNLQAANSRIRDVDVAEESASLSRSQVLSQAAAAVLAQANQAPQLALGLLR